MHRIAISVVVVFLAANALATNGTRVVGFNAKTIGRGGTTIGLFDSPMLMMTNPAGIPFLKRSSIDANFSLMVPSMKFTNILNTDVEGKTNYFPLPGLASVDKKQTAASQSVVAREYIGSTSQLGGNLFHVSLSWLLD